MPPRIKSLDERARVITLAQSAWLQPSSNFVVKLSEYFSLAVWTVYLILIGLGLLLIGNVVLLFFKFRR
jgi:hypothetical protein